jgi:5-methylcytosine-specific restriction endonuclease McrA
MKLSDLNIFDIGGSIGIVGIMLGDNRGNFYYVSFPDQEIPLAEQIKIIEGMDLDNWLKLTKQLDEQEVEIVAKDSTGKLVKAIVRKSQRLVEGRVSSEVLERDHHQCSYCGKRGIPMTVDHLVLWEEGGPSIPENLLTACRKCNKLRGNMQYDAWLKDPYYLKVSKALTPLQRKVNEDLALTLDRIVRRYQQRSSR